MEYGQASADPRMLQQHRQTAAPRDVQPLTEQTSQLRLSAETLLNDLEIIRGRLLPAEEIDNSKRPYSETASAQIRPKDALAVDLGGIDRSVDAARLIVQQLLARL